MKKAFALILITAIICSGCISSPAANVKELSNNTIVENPTNTIENSSQPESKDKNIAVNSGANEADKIENMNVPQRYIEFMHKKGALDDGKTVVFFEKADLDLDGSDEVIIASGTIGESPTDSWISDIYVLKEDNEKLIQIGDNLGEAGYGVYEIKLINLQDLPQKYIYCGLTNGGGLVGFEIIGLNDNKLATICYSASATGAGEDILKDFNSDGKYDGFVQNRWSYDVLYIPLSRTFDLQGKEFVLSDISVDVPEYPENVEDVILQYLSLLSIEADKDPEVQERLSELLMNEDATEPDFAIKYWDELLYHTILGIDGGIEFITSENGDSADVIATFKDDDKKPYKYIFHMIKSENRWRINKIEEDVVK